MYSFETLLHAASDELIAMLSATRVGPLDDQDARREQIAQQFGLKVPQMLCAIGFNAAAAEESGILQVLGFAGFDALAATRNYAFIHDLYQALSINNVLEIYACLSRLHESGNDWSDLVVTRMTSLESQLEETINPVLIGGYKLEIRAIYENGLAASGFVMGRLTPNYAVMQDIANENSIMLERSAIEPAAFLNCAGLSADEKRRVIFQGLIPAPVADRYIRQVQSEEERALLRQALEHLSR